MLSLPVWVVGGRAQQAVPSPGPDASARAPRIASYEMEVELDPAARTVSGHEVLSWVNTGDRPLDRFCFHLYLNAFRNNRSTFLREGRYRSLWDGSDPVPEEYWGYTEVESIVALPDGEGTVREVTSPRPIQPDDGNPEDRTVFEVQVDRPLPPGESIRFRIDFESRLPRGTRRTGWKGDYYFVAQWFPKIGVFQEGAWNCHQYHRSSEYFADFGIYDVSLTVPSGFVVGATGRAVARQVHQDGTTTHRYRQEDVHDFAWTASPRFLERVQTFSYPGLAEVDITLLLQPEHAHLEERYFAATRHALRFYGSWFGEYPYSTLTVVDPAYNSRSGGMEYPTLVTGGAHFLAPGRVLSPEGVTIHEVGHQWFYGMAASNEFEESWLDEGLNSWAESRVAKWAYPPSLSMERILGGIPLVFDALEIPFETSALRGLRAAGKQDVLTRRSWEYLGRDSYVVNSYRKPEMILWTLERLLGEAVMLRGMREFFQSHRFGHPATADFVSSMEQATGRDLDWFFEQTLFSSEVLDYGISVAESTQIPDPEGFFDGLVPGAERSDGSPKTFLTEVVVRRYEGVRFPVEVLLVFEDGRRVRRHWDGQYRWRRFQLELPVRLEYAQVDPERKLLLDVDPTNNSRYRERKGLAPATRKWAPRWLFWLQNLLEIFAFIA